MISKYRTFIKQVLASVSLAVLLASPCFAALDKWGGDDRVKNPTSLYQTGTATATGNFTLTDGSKTWDTNSLAGAILQPSTSAEVYYLIKSNTATEITVYGSDSAGDEKATRHISDDNAGTGAYAVLDRWSVQKVDQRWWLFDPYGNAFFAKSLNDFGNINTSLGANAAGVGHTTAINNHFSGYGTSGSQYAANLMTYIMDTVKSAGFNCLGSIISSAYIVPGSCYSPDAGKTAARLMPFISQIRVNGYGMANTDKFTVNTESMADAYDADFQTDVVTETIAGTGTSANTEGYRNFDVGGCTGRSSWNARYLTPYESGKFNMAANPWFIGYDWAEEPDWAKSQWDNEHLGYRIIISAAGTPRKEQAVTLLTAKYTTIAALNTAWGSSFADWAALDADTGTVINARLSNEPYCFPWAETNTAMLEDLNMIAEDFFRQYAKKVHDALDTLTTVHVLNYGPGLHGWTGNPYNSFAGITSPEYLFRGTVSADQLTPYVDIIGIGDPMHGAHTQREPDMYENMGANLRDYYTFHGRPYHHESVWLTAEADSAMAYAGTITGLTSTQLTDDNAHFDGDGVNTYQYAYGSNAPYRCVLIDPDNHPPNNRVLFTVCRGAQTSPDCPANGGITDTTFSIWKSLNMSDWNWNSLPNMTTVGQVGNPYVFVAHDSIGHIGNGSYPLYIPLTQADRGAMYAKFVNDAGTFTADNGDYLTVGFSQWSWFDFAFRNNGGESRNFGFMTVNGNAYDGSATVANGEIRNCGDFVTPVSAALNGLYNTILTDMGMDMTPPVLSNNRPSGRSTGSPFPAITLTCADCASMLWCSEASQGVACTPATAYTTPFKTPGQNRSWYGYCYNGTDASSNTSATVCASGKREKRR